MKLATFDFKGQTRFGVVVGDGIADATGWVSDAPTLKQLLAQDRVRELEPLMSANPDFRFPQMRYRPPIPDPARIICVGVNYDAHRLETGRSKSEYPTLFVRWGSSVVGHENPIERPQASQRYDFEGELAVIIGRGGRHITRDQALEHVAGYACFNDGSVRDYQRHTSQFTPGKNFDRSGGFGPWMVTADEIPDPSQLSLTTRINGEVMQSAPTRDLIFDVPALIEYISRFTALETGDVIATGTPSGVGDRQAPPVYLKAGDRLEVEVSGVGVLAHPVVDEP